MNEGVLLLFPVAAGLPVGGQWEGRPVAGISQSCLLTATGHMNKMSFGALSPGWWKGGVCKGNEASVSSSGPKDLAQSFDG